MVIILDLFSKVEVSAYLEKIKTKMEDEISSLSDEQVTTIDIDEWREYFYSNYQIEPILVYVDQAELDISEVKIQEYNIWSKHCLLYTSLQQLSKMLIKYLLL